MAETDYELQMLDDLCEKYCSDTVSFSLGETSNVIYNRKNCTLMDLRAMSNNFKSERSRVFQKYLSLMKELAKLDTAIVVSINDRTRHVYIVFSDDYRIHENETWDALYDSMISNRSLSVDVTLLNADEYSFDKIPSDSHQYMRRATSVRA